MGSGFQAGSREERKQFGYKDIDKEVILRSIVSG